jgi:hypothetical protein
MTKTEGYIPYAKVVFEILRDPGKFNRAFNNDNLAGRALTVSQSNVKSLQLKNNSSTFIVLQRGT